MILDNFYYQLFCVFVIGLIMGSFFNVVIIRSLKGEKLTYPPSRCLECETKLEWWQNIPLLSYLILKGKCHYCKTPINIQYPAIELLTSFIFMVSYIKFGFSIKTLFCVSSLSLFLILAGMDIKEKVISTKFAVLLMISSVLFNYVNPVDSILGLVLTFSVISAFRKILGIYFNKEIMGEGDIYVLSALGAFVGLSHLILFGIITLLFQFVFCIPEFYKGMADTKNYNLLYSGLWFVISYTLLFLSKIYIIDAGMFFKILIFVNVFLSLILLCKLLISNIRNSKIPLIEPLSPAIFLSAFIYLFLF